MSEQFDADALLRAATRQVETLQAEVREGRKAARMTKIQVRILGAVCVILLVVVGVIGAFGAQQQNLYDTLHSQQIQSCETGNVQRANEKQVWDSFIDLILQGNKDPQAAAKGAKFKQFIDQVYSPRDCQQAYSTSGTSGDETPSASWEPGS